MMSRSCFTCFLLFLFFVTGSTSPAVAAALLAVPLPAPQDDLEFDLRIAVEVGEPFFIDVDRKTKVDLKINPKVGAVEKRSARSEDRIRCVDEFAYYGDNGDLEATRRFISCHSSDNGAVVDNELTGIAFVFTREGHDLAVTVDDGRRIRGSTVERVRKEAPSLGLRLPLPGSVRRGVPFTVDFVALAPFLFDMDGVVYEAGGEFTLTAANPTAGTARLEGVVSIIEESKEGGLSLESTLSLKTTIDLDMRRKRISAISMKGTGTIAGGDELTAVTGTVRLDVGVKTAGADEALEAMEKKPRYRAVPRFLEDCCLALTLPSHWFVESAGEEILFASSQNTSDAYHLIEIKAVRLEKTPFEEKVAAAEEELKRTAGKVRMKNVSSPLGRGHSFTFGSKGEMTLVEHYPLGHDHLLRIRLRGTPQRFEAALKEYTKARRSLKFVID